MHGDQQNVLGLPQLCKSGTKQWPLRDVKWQRRFCFDQLTQGTLPTVGRKLLQVDCHQWNFHFPEDGLNRSAI